MPNQLSTKQVFTYSFRAECINDVFNLRNSIICFTGQCPMTVVFDPLGLPDVSCEFQTILTQCEINNILADQQDCHVLYQSLRPVPLVENSLERDHSLPLFPEKKNCNG